MEAKKRRLQAERKNLDLIQKGIVAVAKPFDVRLDLPQHQGEKKIRSSLECKEHRPPINDMTNDSASTFGKTHDDGKANEDDKATMQKAKNENMDSKTGYDINNSSVKESEMTVSENKMISRERYLGNPDRKYPEEVTVSDWFLSQDWADSISPDFQHDGKVRFCNQLDNATSGILILALTRQAGASICAQFQDRNTVKEYDAIVHGWPEWEERTLDWPIRDLSEGSFIRVAEMPTKAGSRSSTVALNRAVTEKAQTAQTHVRVIRRGFFCDTLGSTGNPPPFFAEDTRRHASDEQHSRMTDIIKGHDRAASEFKVSLLRVRIFTGRRHQIRVHLYTAGHSILGDAVYCQANMRNFCSQDNQVDACSEEKKIIENCSQTTRRRHNDPMEVEKCRVTETHGRTEAACLSTTTRHVFRMFLHAAYLEFPELDGFFFESPSGFDQFIRPRSGR